MGSALGDEFVFDNFLAADGGSEARARVEDFDVIGEIAEPIEVRKRAFAALKALLLALSASSRLIVHIDDLQWSDIDSLVLLEELLRPPNAPALI